MSETPPPEGQAPQAPQPGTPEPQSFPAPGYFPPYGPAYPVPRTDNQAIAALICAIAAVPVGLVCYGVPGIALGLVGFFLGRSAQKRIKQSQGWLTGLGMAKAAWIVGLAAAVFSALMLVAMVGLFAFLIVGSQRGWFPTPTPSP